MAHGNRGYTERWWFSSSQTLSLEAKTVTFDHLNQRAMLENLRPSEAILKRLRLELKAWHRPEPLKPEVTCPCLKPSGNHGIMVLEYLSTKMGNVYGVSI